MESMQGVLKSLDGIIDRAENALSGEAAPAAAGATDAGAVNAAAVGAAAAVNGEKAAKAAKAGAVDAGDANGGPPMRKKKEKKPKKPKAPPAPALPPSTTQFHQCDLRTGLVKSASHHPEADALFVLSVDVGDPEPRSICAGLRGFVDEKDLVGALVVIICNLKPRNLRGVPSNGMLLAASVVSEGEKERVVPIWPPEGATAGDFVAVEGMEGERTVVEGKFVNAKTWGKVCPRLIVTGGEACYEGKKLLVGDGVIKCDLPDGAQIH